MSSNMIKFFAQIFFYIFYKDNLIQFLLNLEQISFKYFAISFITHSIVLVLVNKNPNRIYETRRKQIILRMIEKQYLRQFEFKLMKKINL